MLFPWIHIVIQSYSEFTKLILKNKLLLYNTMTKPTTVVGGARTFGLANLGFCSLPEYICNHRSFFNSNISLFFIQYLSVSLAPFHCPSLCLTQSLNLTPCFLNAPIFISATWSWFQRAGTRVA